MKQRLRLSHPVIVITSVLVVVASLLFGAPFIPALITGGAIWVILRVGVAMLGGLARPIPEPPPAGELRKVKIAYRCDICGTEVRMTISPDEDPEPPRHCQEDMTEMAPIDI